MNYLLGQGIRREITSLSLELCHRKNTRAFGLFCHEHTYSEAPLSSWLVGPERLLIKANDIMNILNGEYLAFGCKGGGIGNNIKRHRGTSFSACSPLCLFGIITVLVFHRAAIGSKNSLSTSMYYSHPT